MITPYTHLFNLFKKLRIDESNLGFFNCYELIISNLILNYIVTLLSSFLFITLWTSFVQE